MGSIDDAAVEALSQDFRGELIRPSDTSYDERRRIFNGTFDPRPALIARCSGTADVASAVRFAREHGIPTAVRGGGHGVAGFATIDDGLVIDLSAMRAVRVDPERKTARAQGGATWGDYDRETQAHGLASPGGLVSTTGIAGLTLGGGFGFLSAKHGMACDSMIGADVVTADGEVIVVNEDTNADLLWGLRGGGGNFGIVTSFEYKLYPQGDMFVGMFLFRPEQAFELLRYYQTFIEEAPDGFLAFAAFMTMPTEAPIPIFPPEVLGKQVAAIMGAWPGPVEDGEKAFAPLRGFGEPLFEITMPMPYTMAQSFQDEDVPWGTYNYWKNTYVEAPSDGLFEVLAERVFTAPSPYTQIPIGKMGGAIMRSGPEDSSFPLRDGGWIVQFDSNWREPSQAEENIAWTRDIAGAIEPFTAERGYVNFMEDVGTGGVARAYGPERHARLQALKKTWDPANFFNRNQNITPA